MSTDRPRVLVTGATGFVGRHLALALAENGWNVRGATRLIPTVPVSGVNDWVLVRDVGSIADWAEALRGVSIVVHLAALAHCVDPKNRPSDEEYMRVNALGTRCVADAAAMSGEVRRFIYVSSIGAVTDASEEIVEEGAPTKPVSAYGRSKLAAEGHLREGLSASSVDWCVLRPVLVYGPGNPGNMARLLRLVSSGIPLPLAGIRNRRSFIFVGSLVGAIERLMTARGIAGCVFNVADDEAVSTPELIRMIAAASGQKTRLWAAPHWFLHGGAFLGDIFARFGIAAGIDTYSLNRLEASLRVSTQALREATGWHPPFTLVEGIQATLGPPRPESA